MPVISTKTILLFILCILLALSCCENKTEETDAGIDAASDQATAEDRDGSMDSDADSGMTRDAGQDADIFAWHTFLGSPASETGNSIILDRYEGIFISGISYDSWAGPLDESPLHEHSEEDEDLFVLNMGLDGSYKWHTYMGTREVHWMNSICRDNVGNLYVAGSSFEPWAGHSGEPPLNKYNEFSDLFIAKLGPDGSYKWHTFFGSDLSDYACSIAADKNGNLYVTGSSTSSWRGPSGEGPLHQYALKYDYGYNDFFVLKIGTDGEYKWHTFYRAGDRGFAYSPVLDESGNIYLTGESEVPWKGPSGEEPKYPHSEGDNSDIFILKLGNDGSYIWHTFLGGEEFDTGRSVALDRNGDVLVTGECHHPGTGLWGSTSLNEHSGGTDIFVAKFGSDGTYRWHTFYSGGVGQSIAVDETGSVFITGYSWYCYWNGTWDEEPLNPHSQGKEDIFLLKLKTDGAYVKHIYLGSDGYDSGEAMALDENGNVYITGSSNSMWYGPSGEVPLNEGLWDEKYFRLFLLKLSGF